MPMPISPTNPAKTQQDTFVDKKIDSAQVVKTADTLAAAKDEPTDLKIVAAVSFIFAAIATAALALFFAFKKPELLPTLIQTVNPKILVAAAGFAGGAIISAVTTLVVYISRDKKVEVASTENVVTAPVVTTSDTVVPAQ